VGAISGGDPLNRASATGGTAAQAGQAKPTYPPRSLAIRALAMSQTLA